MKVLIEVPDFDDLDFLGWEYTERGQWTLDHCLKPWCWTDITPSHERRMTYVIPESLSEERLAKAREQYPIGSFFKVLYAKPILVVEEVHQDTIYKHKISIGFTDVRNGFNYVPIEQCEPVRLEERQ
jgi:hypothetical protein